MANKVFNYYKELPSWAKGVVVIGGIAILYFTTKSILKRVKLSVETKNEREALKTQEDEIKKEQTTGAKATYPESQYKTWASQIKNQYDGCDGSFGRPILQFIPPTWLGNIMWSNSGALTSNIFFKLKNNIDFLKLSSAFGISTYDQCGLWNGDFKGNLQSAIVDELDENERKALNDILKKNGITYNV
jgi:hypothetical protein